jgi:hypothetical protein
LESYASGRVTAEGTNLPYAGGVTGYISAGSSVKNCWSAVEVTAAAASKQALAGGISGAVARDNSVISKCYALGTVTAHITGGSAADTGGTLGVPAAANAGGITGALYVGSPQVEYCAALNGKVEGVDTGGGELRVYRIAGVVDGSLEQNIANAGMALIGGEPAADRGGNAPNGADAEAKPAQETFTRLGWDFDGLWIMGSEGYPVLRRTGP